MRHWRMRPHGTLAHGDREKALPHLSLLREARSPRLLEVQDAEAREIHGEDRARRSVRKRPMEVRRSGDLQTKPQLPVNGGRER